MAMSWDDLRVFDNRQDMDVCHRKLPHWSQPGTITFITFRTNDSLPSAVMQGWIESRDRWLRGHGIDPEQRDWKERVRQLPSEVSAELRHLIGAQWHNNLDACAGECVLRQRELAEIVVSSLQHFHGDRYLLLDFVVMPNHVHLLAAFSGDQSMLAQCDSWKHFTATKINRKLGRSGRFWQQDGFDHLVRTESHLEWFQRYIADNPRKARLKDGEYIYGTNRK